MMATPFQRLRLLDATEAKQPACVTVAPDPANPSVLNPGILAAKQEEFQWCHDHPSVAALRTTLAAEIPGGLVLADPWDGDLDEVVCRGVAMCCPVIPFGGPIPQHCHWNAAFITWATEGRYQLATGYALSADGLWVSHSWNVELGPQGEPRRIVETTTDRLAYFGIILSSEEAVTRWNNIRTDQFRDDELSRYGFSPDEIDAIFADDPSMDYDREEDMDIAP